VRALGLRVAVADADPDAPGMALADDRVVCSTYDAEGMIAAARELAGDAHGLSGVLSIAADVPVTVARVAHALGLPGIPVATAEACADKLAMKDRLAAAGVPVPWYAPLSSAGALAAARAEHGTVVVKPVDSRGARGVLRVTADVDCAWAYEHARAASPSKRAMVEAFLDGPQLSTESILVDGRATTLACSDRNYARLAELAPYVIEDGGVQPSAHLGDVLDDANALVERCAAALGMATGTLKGDFVLTDAGLAVIEVAPRLSGGWLATDQVPWSTGVDLVQLAARLALGERLTLEERTPRSFRPIAVRYFFPARGVLRAIEGFEAVAAEPWCRRAVLFARPGDRLERPTDHTRRAGLVLASGDTREEAVRRAEEAVRRVRFVLDDSVGT
jgi:biotin carboxylase